MGKAEFAEYSKKLRIRSGLSQKDVADALDLQSGQLISNWERGACYPPVRMLKRISELYNVTIKELFNAFTDSQKEDLWKKIQKRA